MPKDSLKNLLNQFPFFLDKTPNSNFYKIQDVFNNQFKDLYQSLFEVYESFKLEKRLFIWKEQDEPYVYQINFAANYPNLKCVKIYKNSNLIYTENYLYEDNVSKFEYSYSYDTRNDTIIIVEGGDEEVIEANVIPNDEFILEVETYDEYLFRKGFPENDLPCDNEFDHDISLDEIGVLNNIPRKEYIFTTDYANTEPKYNDRLTEDDYHYMNRMIEYALRLHDDYAPILELWKLYGVNATMLNRERFLVKMFDITKHPHSISENGELLVGDWNPEPWEHKDKFCDEGNLLGEFFFAQADNVQPVKKRNVIFEFYFVNSLAKKLKDDYVVDIYLNDNLLDTIDDLVWICDSNLLDEYYENVFKFVGKRNEIIIGTVEIPINVKGCNTADIYVKQDTGNDKNSGDRENPYKTLEKGINSVTIVKDLIAIFGNINTTGKIPVNESCTIIGCNNATITNNENPIFFNLTRGNILTSQDITYITDHFQGLVEDMSWINENENKIETALAYNLQYGVLIDDIIPEKFVKNFNFNSETGILSWEEFDKSELTHLFDFEGINTNLELTDDLYISESEIFETEDEYLNGQFVFFEDRKDLINAIFDIEWDSQTGIMSYDEVTDDEIAFSAKLHNILGVE